jgi:hypothetical protein
MAPEILQNIVDTKKVGFHTFLTASNRAFFCLKYGLVRMTGWLHETIQALASKTQIFFSQNSLFRLDVSTGPSKSSSA